MADDSSPLNMGAPWAALGGSDVAPVNAGSFVPVGGGQVDPVAQEQFAKLRDIGARLAVQNEMSKAPQPAEETRIKKNKDGSEDVWTKTSRQNYENTIQGAMNYQHALGGYAQRMEQIEQHLAAQEQQARNQPPWVQLATALSANIAQAKNMPGWVQALGKTAADLNPRPDQIAQRRLGVLGEEAKLAEQGARMGEAQMSHQDNLAMRQAQLAETASRDRATEASRKGTGLARLDTDAAKSAREAMFDGGSYYKERLALGDTPEQANTATTRLEAINDSATVTKKLKEAAAEKKDAETVRKLDEQERHNKVVEAQGERRLDGIEKKVDTALAKKKDIPDKTKTTIRELLMARESGKELLKLFDPDNPDQDVRKAQALMGPIAGRLTEAKQSWGSLSKDEAAVVNKVNKQFVNAVSTMGTGTYGYRISERGFVKSFTEAMKNNPGQNYGNLKNWMDWYDQQLSIIAKQYDIGDIESAAPPAPGMGIQGPGAKDEIWTPEKVKALRGGK